MNIVATTALLATSSTLASRDVADGALIGAIIGLVVMVIAIIVGLIQKSRARKGSPATPAVPARSIAPAEKPDLPDDCIELPKEDAQPLLERIAGGEAACFMWLGRDRALFHARLKGLTAYAATRSGALAVVGARETREGPYMVLTVGSREEHDRQSRESRTGGELDLISQKILTPAELNACRPADAYSNYALPGCELISMDGFNRCVERLKSGNWSVVTVNVPLAGVPSAPKEEKKTGADTAAINAALEGLMKRLRVNPEPRLPCLTIEVQHHLGEDAVAWAEPDARDFDVAGAEALVKETLAPLGVNVSGASHTCDRHGRHLVIWFIKKG